MADAEAQIAKEYNQLRGRLCGLVESWGLDEKQERGMIATLKTLTYSSEEAVKKLVSK